MATSKTRTENAKAGRGKHKGETCLTVLRRNKRPKGGETKRGTKRKKKVGGTSCVNPDLTAAECSKRTTIVFYKGRGDDL